MDSGVNSEVGPKFRHSTSPTPTAGCINTSSATVSPALRASNHNEHNVLVDHAPRAPGHGQVHRPIAQVQPSICLYKTIADLIRTFTTLVPLRPSLTPMNGAIRRTVLPSAFTPSTGASADIVPSSAISAHPAMGDMQIRCGPRNTMNGHTRLVQKRRHGFLVRKRSKTGRKILLRRKIKGRRHIAQ